MLPRFPLFSLVVRRRSCRRGVVVRNNAMPRVLRPQDWAVVLWDDAVALDVVHVDDLVAVAA